MPTHRRIYSRPREPTQLTAAAARRATIDFNSDGPIRVNLGRICYRKRERRHLSEAWLLDQATFDRNRVKLVNDILIFVHTKRAQIADSSVYKHITSFLNYVDWADRQGLNPLSTGSDSTLHYWIDHEIWGNVKTAKWREPYAYKQLLYISEVLGWLHDVTLDTLWKGKAIPRKLRRFSTQTQTPDDKAYEKYLIACYDVFRSLNCDGLKQSFPLIVKSRLLKKPLEIWHGTRPPRSGLAGLPGLMQTSFKAANTNLRHTRRIEAANLAVKAFISMLIAVTSLNVGQILSLKMEGSASWIKERSGFYELVAIKNRAKGRQVLFTVSSAFRGEVERYFELRKWLLAEEPSELFIVLRDGKSGNLINMTSSRVVAFNRWLRSQFQIEHMTPRMLRKKKSDRVLSKYRSPLLASWVLQNSAGTIETHYSEGEPQKAASELGLFFKLLRKFSKEYLHPGRPEPKLKVVAKSARTVKLLSGGQCTNYPNPEKNLAYSNRAPDPDCSSRLSLDPCG